MHLFDGGCQFKCFAGDFARCDRWAVTNPTEGACAEAVRSCLCFNLRNLTRAVKGVYDEALRPSGLSSGQFALLLALRVSGRITKRDLAFVARTDRTALTRNLQPLIRRKLVRETAGADRRTRCVELTSSGIDSIRTAIPAWETAQATAATLLTQPGMDDLLQVVHRSIERFDDGHSKGGKSLVSA